MFKFIIGFCSFMIAYATLNLLYALKECYFQSAKAKKTKMQDERTIKTEIHMLRRYNLEARKIPVKRRIMTKPRKKGSGVRLRTERVAYKRMMYDIDEQNILCNRLVIDDKIKKDITELISDAEIKRKAVKDLSSDAIQSMPSHKYGDELKNETNIDC